MLIPQSGDGMPKTMRSGLCALDIVACFGIKDHILTQEQESLIMMLNFRLICMTISYVILLSHAIILHYFTATWLKLTLDRCKLAIPVLYELIGDIIDGPIKDQVGQSSSNDLVVNHGVYSP